MLLKLITVIYGGYLLVWTKFWAEYIIRQKTNILEWTMKSNYYNQTVNNQEKNLLQWVEDDQMRAFTSAVCRTQT